MAFGTAQVMGRPVAIKDEGVTLTTNVGSSDFTGLGVTGTTIGADVTENISGSTGSIVYDETPSGSGTAFTLAHAPSPAGSLILWKNGQNLTAGGIDFTLSGANITLVQAMGGNDTLLAKQYTY